MKLTDFKNRKYLFIALLIAFAVFVPFILFNDHLFIFAGDSYEQQVKMYIQAWSRLRDGSLPFWDWSNFLGNNYFGSSTFYFLGSPFFWLSMLLPDKEMIPYFFLTLNILKSLCCVLFGYCWLNKVTQDDLGSSIGALMITFSGFILINYTNNHMLDAVLMMPLILYFAECFLQNRRFTGLVISIGVLGIVSYYFLYLFLPFLCVYTLIRYFVIHEKIEMKEMIKAAGLFIFYVLLGVVVSCVVLIPSFLALKENPRTADFALGLNTIGKANLFRLITSFINPINDWRQNANFFVSTSIDSGIGWCGGMTNYSLILSVFLIIPLLSIKKSREKIGIFVLYGIYLLFSVFPMFYVLFNQNYESRWMVVFTLIMALLSATALAHRNQIERKFFLISGFAVILIMAGCLLLSIKMNYVFEFWEVNILKRNVLVLSVIVLIYTFLFVLRARLRNRIFPILVLVFVFIEIGFSFYNCFYNLDETNHPMDQETLNSLHLFDNQVIEAIKQKDDSFYRIDIATVRPLSFNDALSNRYRSFNVYHSIYNYKQSEFILDRFNTRGSWIFNPQKGKGLLKSMLGAKYWYSYGGEISDYRGVVMYGFEDIPPYGYEKIETIDGVTIYQNQYPLSFAYAMHKTIDAEMFKQYSQFEQDRMFLNHVVLEQGETDSLEYVDSLETLKKKGEDISVFDLSNKSKGVIYLVFERSYYNGYRFLNQQGDIIAQGGLTNEMGYTSLNIPEEATIFELDNAKTFDVYYDSMVWLDEWYDQLLDQSAQNVEWDDNSISGMIEIEQDAWIVTGVPYDSGWTVKLNGEKVDYEKVNLGFVGIYAEAGVYLLEMDYVPSGLVGGALLSISGLTMVGILNFLQKRKKTSN